MHRQKLAVLIAAVLTVLLPPSLATAQTDYVLQLGKPHIPANASTFSGMFWGSAGDSIAIMRWQMSPVVNTGGSVKVLVHWKFWTSHSPVCYMNYFGDWQPNSELARSSMYGGIPSPNEEFIDTFRFVAPSSPGWYRVRFMPFGGFSPTPSFYGSASEGPSCYSEMLFHVGYPLGVAEQASLPPSGVARIAAFPNPFRSAVSLTFTLPRNSQAVVRVYDAAGKLTTTIAQGKMSAGEQTRIWNGTDDQGHVVAPGDYFFTVEAGDHVIVKKAVRLE